jgi:mono/diheme cytochrome c family protein
VTAEPVSFRKQVAQLLLDNCLACHGPKKAEGGYRIDAYERLIKAGDSDEVAVTPSKLDASELFRRIATDDESERMPLEGDPLPAEQIALIKQWIEEGAKFDGEDPKAARRQFILPHQKFTPIRCPLRRSRSALMVASWRSVVTTN